jgi:hypothetical protein
MRPLCLEGIHIKVQMMQICLILVLIFSVATALGASGGNPPNFLIIYLDDVVKQ